MAVDDQTATSCCWFYLQKYIEYVFLWFYSQTRRTQAASGAGGQANVVPGLHPVGDLFCSETWREPMQPRSSTEAPVIGSD